MSTESTAYVVNGRAPDWSLLPEHMHHVVKAWIENGECDDEFFTAFLKNDLKACCQYADLTNRRRLWDYVSFFYMYAPLECWGTEEKLQAWAKRGGLRGGESGRQEQR